MTTIRALRGDDVAARDGIVGQVEDVFFDEAQWAVRFFVVDTGGPGRRLLVPPSTVEPGLSGKRKLRLGLTVEQLEQTTAEPGAGRLAAGRASSAMRSRRATARSAKCRTSPSMRTPGQSATS